ncbi:MAG: dihydroneopterin aldolase, partial [Gemmatimonadaceae bacterium]
TAHGAEGVADYRDIYDAVARVVNTGHVLYLEDMADSMAEEILRSAPVVLGVSISIRKPHVALGGPLSHAEVTIERRRE